MVKALCSLGWKRGSSQSHADYMKTVNDYLYGSGKSSLCPFDQGGYCN